MGHETAAVLRLLPGSLIRAVLSLSDHVAGALVGLKVSPNAVTTAGFLAGTAAGALYALDRPFPAAAALALSGVLDILDGQVAKRSKGPTLFGAVYDSSMDRYTEFFVLCGLAFHFRSSWVVWAAFFAFLGSTMVSYIRARAEGVGLSCRVGLMQRAERLVLVVVGTVAGAALGIFDPVMTGVIAFIAFISNMTALQRLVHVRAQAKKRSTSTEVGQ